MTPSWSDSSCPPLISPLSPTAHPSCRPWLPWAASAVGRTVSSSASGSTRPTPYLNRLHGRIPSSSSGHRRASASALKALLRPARATWLFTARRPPVAKFARHPVSLGRSAARRELPTGEAFMVSVPRDGPALPQAQATSAGLGAALFRDEPG